MISMLLAYDPDGQVFATLDYMVRYDADGRPLGLIDFDAHELAGAEMTDVWQVEGAAGSKTWPEWIGARAHDFRVELVGPPGRKRIAALVHAKSGFRRERANVEAAIAQRIAAAKGEPANITDIVGSPEEGRALRLTSTGRTETDRPIPPPTLPVVALARPSEPEQVHDRTDGNGRGKQPAG